MNKKINKDRRGFTLIELLVVVAIIGILTSIVLINVNSARMKAKDAAIKTNIKATREFAEMFYDDKSPTTYAGACSDATFIRIEDAITTQMPSGGSIQCGAGVTGYCFKASLNLGGIWCVDSSGYFGSNGSACTVATSTVCN